MTVEQIIRAAQKYHQVILSAWPGEDLRANRLEDDEHFLKGRQLARKRKDSHALFMCQEIERLAESPENLEKVMRWLGFIQCYMWLTHDFSIADLKDDNR